jgi:tetratricopeptide (TPR) repeat protein
MVQESGFLSNEEFFAAREQQAAEAKRDRARAEDLWKQLQRSGEPQAWRDQVLAEPKYHLWTVCEKLCHESAELADDDPARAGELAGLALELVPKLTISKSRASALQEYIWMHIGNVCRGRGDLKRAAEAFEKAKEFFLDGIMPTLPGSLIRGHLEALESALLRDQGRLREAVEKIGSAITLGSERSPYRPAIWLEKGRLERRLGQTEEALKSVLRAGELAIDSTDWRLRLRILIELGSLYCALGQHEEVTKATAAVLNEARKHPAEHARLLILEGRAAAGRGRIKEAEAALQKGRAVSAKAAAGDLVLLSLELAVLYAKKGRSRDLRSLAEPTLKLAESLRREAAATLRLFCRLAEQEKISVERAEQFLRDFVRMI